MILINRIKNKVLAIWAYICHEVWSDTRKDWRINVIKTLNLSVRSFLDGDLQSRAAALTYRTLLAMVPALAILFAIGRGFGFHKLLQTQLFSYFPAQKEALETAFTFVESCLTQASEGAFMGIGIAMLLWTMISLMNNIESSFNTIWGIKRGRNIWRKITDYTAMLMILPILMICASGLSLFMTSTLQDVFNLEFMSPIISFLFEFASCLFTWLFFTAMFMLIPNTKVKFKNAFIAGVFSGTGFLILQWLFVSGQVYVSKYNAIYGSFSLLPLLLIWMHLTWVVILSGIVICYSSQSIYHFSFSNKINDISINYRTKITIAIMTIITQAFKNNQRPIQINDLTTRYEFPPRIVTDVVEDLIEANLVSRVINNDNDEEIGFQPACDINNLSLGAFLERINNLGNEDFIPNFSHRFEIINNTIEKISTPTTNEANKIFIKDIVLNKID